MSARKPTPTAWWLRPVSRLARVGEQIAVTWKRLYRRPPAASRSMFGVSMAEPKQPSWAKPRSSKRMTMTFGAPAGGCGIPGCLALLSAGVRPSWARVSLSGRVGLRSVAALAEPGPDRRHADTDGPARHP